MRSRRKQDEKGGRWCGDHSAHSSPFLGRFTREYMMTWQFYHSPIWFGAPVVDVRVIRDERPISSARFFRAAPTRKTDVSCTGKQRRVHHRSGHTTAQEQPTNRAKQWWTRLLVMLHSRCLCRGRSCSHREGKGGMTEKQQGGAGRQEQKLGDPEE
ncbi:hypothetical protein OPV22_022979 [Ensete ventricosum]|uniref:Uncharacterized protein n=1 Tax=Ensete ventricosum TaxID=4639 RepID=A0AAV8QRY2_ENSVE|nr:hypothetical protein OPV22_022979 [Ensete ventricosum]